VAEVRTKSSTGGEKGVKLARFDLLPVGPLTELAEHYGVGASKYANHQWRQGYEWSKSYSALMRHLTAFWAGLDYDVCSNDPEGCSQVDLEGKAFVAVREDACFNHTGSHHMAAVAWHSFLLLEFKDAHQQHDDRYVDSNALETDLSQRLPLTDDFKARMGYDDAEAPVTTGIRDGFDIPEPEEPLHGLIQGERAQDLIDGEGPVEHPMRWVRDYDNENHLRDFPRIETGLPTLAEAFESNGFAIRASEPYDDSWILNAVRRQVFAADKAVEDRLREQLGPDLLSKRSPIDWGDRSGG